MAPLPFPGFEKDRPPVDTFTEQAPQPADLPFIAGGTNVVLLPHMRFLADRAAELWDAGQPLRDGETVSDRVARFAPTSVRPEVWARIRPLVQQAADAAAATPYRAGTLAALTAQLAHWCDREGLAITNEVVFHPDTVDRFVVQGCAQLASGTQLNYRCQLRRVGERLLGPPLYPLRPVPMRASGLVAPYSTTEVAALVGWARGATTFRMRHNLMVLLSFGMGAGLTSQEVNTVVGSDVSEDVDGLLVKVSGPRARIVPVLRRWEDHVREAADLAGWRPVFLTTRTKVSRKDVTGFVERCATADAPRLRVQRLRATWIVHHLAARTPLQALQTAAGASAAQLAGYATYLPALDPGLARRLLREAGSQ